MDSFNWLEARQPVMIYRDQAAKQRGRNPNFARAKKKGQ
jgi:hypothetical protein